MLYAHRRESAVGADGEPVPLPIPGSFSGKVPQIIELVTVSSSGFFVKHFVQRQSYSSFKYKMVLKSVFSANLLEHLCQIWILGFLVIFRVFNVAHSSFFFLP